MEKTKVKTLVRQIRGVSYKPEDLHNELDDNSVVLLRANNIDEGKINFDDVVYVDKSKVSDEQYLKYGDILICASSGSKNLVGKAASIRFNTECTFGAFCKVIRPKEGLDEYLSVYFQSPIYRRKISEVAIGVNINNIRNEHIDELDIPVFSNDEQASIVKKIHLIQEVISNRKAELEKLDDLIKARFVEMFGFPGTDEKGWGLRPLRECCEINPKKVSDKRLASGVQVSFVPMTAVSENGEIKTTEKKTYDEVKVGFTYFAENDVLFAKITPCMENGKGAVAVGLCNGIGFGSTEFHVLRPLTGRSNPYWLYSLISFDTFRKDAAANMTGSAGQRRVPAMFLEKYKITLPPFELQNQFANFVHQVDKSKFIDIINLLKILLFFKRGMYYGN